MKAKIHLSFVLLLTLIISSNSNCQTEQKDFDFNQYHREATSLANPRFSPDGNYLLYSTRSADFESNNWVVKNRLMNLLTKDEVVLQFEQKGVREIKWSPSGKYLSFIASANGTSQIHIQEFPNGAIQILSNHSSNISRYFWSHDESKIAFTAMDTPPLKAESEKFKTAFEVGPQGYLVDSKPLSTHLYVLHLASKSETRLTDGTWTINSNISWSLNDEQLAFSKKEDAYSSRWDDSKIMFYHLNSNTLTELSNKTKFEYDPSFTPEGNHLLYDKKDGNSAGLTDLYIQYKNKTTRNLSLPIDRTIKSYEWLYSKNEILIYGKDGSTDGVWISSLDGNIKKASFSNSFVISSLTTNKKGEIVFVGSTGNQPSELFYLKDHSSKPVQLTHYNDIFKNMNLGRVETIEWKTDLNIKTDGIVTYPPNFKVSEKYPLVLLIHGGPTASSMDSFNPQAQEFARNGWVVFQPNYRGSDNHGETFQEAIMNDGGEGPGRDVMAGIEAIKLGGYIDENKIAVTGWSYGGFMTAWLIGKYPDVWKTAVAGAAPVDYTDMTSLTGMNMTLRHAITNSPWVDDNYQIYYDMSPLKNLSRIKTPTLIMSKIEDQIVSVTGSYKLYHALLANDIPVQFIAYPGGGHSPSDPINSKDVYDRWIAWLKKYLD